MGKCYTYAMNIFFSGIGGVGIGPLAEIAYDAGYGVQGSDAQASPTTETLRKKGIEIALEQDGSFLEICHQTTPIDWYIYTSALRADHPELLKARELGIKTAKRDELLAHIIEEKNLKLIAISGTHGKTTTTGMLVWVLQNLGVPISYSVGAALSFGPSGTYLPGSEYFIYECDEFDRNFLHFSPYLSLITSVDYDHPDTYPTPDEYFDAFRQFAHQSGHVIMWQHDNTHIADNISAWLLGDQEIAPLAVAGAHNRRNATLVLKAIEYLGLDQDKARLLLEAFPGTARRFEKLGQNLYSDYGHHPVEIAATLQLAREITDNIVLVYQPHQNIRQHEIRADYIDCFEGASEIYWLPTYLSREDPALPILTPSELIRDVTNKQIIRIAELDDSLWKTIQSARDKGKLVLLMGAGNIDAWARKHLSI